MQTLLQFTGTWLFGNTVLSKMKHKITSATLMQHNYLCKLNHFHRVYSSTVLTVADDKSNNCMDCT